MSERWYLEFDDAWAHWIKAQIHEQYEHKKIYVDERPTVKPATNFDATEDAKALRKAMKGFGTSEDEIIEILTKRSTEQRMEIQEKYKSLHDRNLAKDLKSELTGSFEKVTLALLKPLPLFYAEQVKYATKGAGTDETAIIEIFCTRDNDFVKTVQETFEKTYETSLEKVLCKETSGQFEKLLKDILANYRDDSKASPGEVADQLCAEDIDEDKIRIILTSFTFPFLKKVFALYLEQSGKDFTELVDKKCHGDCKQAFKAIYLSSHNRTEFFAHALRDAIKGCGTDDTTLIRIIVGRCEIDLESIKKKYSTIFESDLVKDVRKEISGDYEKTVMNLLGCD